MRPLPATALSQAKLQGRQENPTEYDEQTMDTQALHIKIKGTESDEYIKWICGLANAQGGRLYIEARDSGPACGAEDARKLMEEIKGRVRDAAGWQVTVNLKEIEGRSCIVVETDACSCPVSFKGKYYLSSGGAVQELKGAALDRFILFKQGKPWDGVPVPYLKAGNLDNAAFDVFRKHALRSKRMAQEDLTAGNRAMLKKLRLYEGKYLKRAAVLLFHPDPEAYVQGAFVKIGFFREGMDLVFQDEVHGNLFVQIAKLMDLLCTKYLKAVITYEGIQRVETFPMPPEALREALLNALINKNYAERSPIQIRVYENKLEIVNGGALPEGWTAQTLLSPHPGIPYNPHLAGAFFCAGEIEGRGRGIEKIIASCRQEGFSAPQFRCDASGMWTIFNYEYPARATMQNTAQKTSQNTAQKPALKTTQKTDQKTLCRLTKRQQEILSFLKEHPPATRKEISKSLGSITEDGVKYNLARLKDLGLLKRVGGRKQGFWQISGS